MRGLEERTIGQRWVDSISHSLSASKCAEFGGSPEEVSGIGDEESGRRNRRCRWFDR